MGGLGPIQAPAVQVLQVGMAAQVISQPQGSHSGRRGPRLLPPLWACEMRIGLASRLSLLLWPLSLPQLVAQPIILACPKAGLGSSGVLSRCGDKGKKFYEQLTHVPVGLCRSVSHGFMRILNCK